MLYEESFGKYFYSMRSTRLDIMAWPWVLGMYGQCSSWFDSKDKEDVHGGSSGPVLFYPCLRKYVRQGLILNVITFINIEILV